MQEGVDAAASSSGSDSDEAAAPAPARRPRLRPRPGREPRSAAVSAAQQAELNQQAMAEAFRFYLAPEAGGVGVALQPPAPPSAAKVATRAPKPTGDDGGGSESDDGSGSESDVSLGQFSSTHSPSESCSDTGGSDADADDADGRGAEAQGFFDRTPKPPPPLSPFGSLWRLLGTWLTPESILHVHGRMPASTGAPVVTEQTAQVQQVILKQLLARLPATRDSVGLPLSIPVLQEHLHALVATFRPRGAAPYLPEPSVDALLLVLLAAVARRRLPAAAAALRPQALRCRAELDRLELSDELFNALLDAFAEGAH